MLSTTTLYLVTALNGCMCSTSWYELRCWCIKGRWPVIATTGDKAKNASWRPAAKFAAPTDWAMQTPGLLEVRAYPSAI